MNEELLSRLDSLAGYLNTKTEFLWDVLVRRGTAEGVSDIFTFLLCIAVGYLCYLAAKWGTDSASEDWLEDDPIFMFAQMGGAIGIIGAAAIAATHLKTGIIYILAPEFYAIDMITGLIK